MLLGIGYKGKEQAYDLLCEFGCGLMIFKERTWLGSVSTA